MSGATIDRARRELSSVGGAPEIHAEKGSAVDALLRRVTKLGHGCEQTNCTS